VSISEVIAASEPPSGPPVVGPPPPPPAPAGRRPVVGRAPGAASAYDLAVAGESELTRATLRAVFASPSQARTAVLAAEVLGPPRALRPYGAP
jgi:hypothetical protein